ncbi:hypothetical protein [Ruminiclostridium cellulolyticum]|uniref:Uncharacterized protein n=1 Tax=Ruminiclostridium cellulolyticum (strain ATCC 35319 / DSM 5812 / JCM 6584 / H10) TaxID=394503 RepID=B8I8X8_RUMCH|nr:hypothetical protein [Ruminiclostridium cellulolyticum]ACL77310.1 hypothetical protein Ccel_3018 [Ruminiclostridium cellulolyticum H10]
MIYYKTKNIGVTSESNIQLWNVCEELIDVFVFTYEVLLMVFYLYYVSYTIKTAKSK